MTYLEVKAHNTSTQLSKSSETEREKEQNRIDGQVNGTKYTNL